MAENEKPVELWGARLPDGSMWQHGEIYRDAKTAAAEVLYYKEWCACREHFSADEAHKKYDSLKIARKLGYKIVRVKIVEDTKPNRRRSR